MPFRRLNQTGLEALLKPVSQVRILPGARLPGARCDVSGHRNRSEPALGSGFFRAGPLGCAPSWPQWDAPFATGVARAALPSAPMDAESTAEWNQDGPG